MANTNAPFGLRWLGFATGSAAPTFSLIPQKVKADNTHKFYKGDGVQTLNSGYVDAVQAASVAASQWTGVFSSASYLSTAFGRRVTAPYFPGGDTVNDVDVLLVPLIGSPPQLFVAQVTSTACAFADLGLNVDIAYSAGTAYTGTSKSALTIDMSTKATTATLPFRLVNLWSAIAAPGAPGADDTTSYNWVIVEFNSNQQTGI